MPLVWDAREGFLWEGGEEQGLEGPGAQTLLLSWSGGSTGG